MSLSFRVPHIFPAYLSWQISGGSTCLELNMQEEKVHTLSELCAVVQRPVQTKCARGCVWLFVKLWQFVEQFLWRVHHTLYHNGCWFIITMLRQFAHFLVECFFRKSCLQDPNKHWKCFHIIFLRCWCTIMHCQ